ncbi:uncharacterized protein [Rutidosis leptorrhynchoides]|uniref:uncharacterized protein n=1 Tax=Rutidosis leptorrhynchoides TaxID=125765 RepID=UPI003A9965EF
MVADDEDNTAFHTSQCIYCYTKMPFGLKNVGATYQRVIDDAFKCQIGRNLEAYVDDLVIKSTTEHGLLDDILEMFASLRKINMKLNPSKCSFGEEEGKFLGHIITEREIRANPKKIEAIKKNGFQVDRGSRSCVSRNEKVVKGIANDDCADCRRDVNTLLSGIKEAISLVLIAKRGQVQMPVYFVSKALTGSELKYPTIEKLVYALVHTARCLRRYFQEHPIMVLTDQPIKHVLYKPENSGRMTKWAIELASVTNNEAEYEALLSGMRVAKYMEVKELSVYVDSQLVANQINGIFKAHDESMQNYLKLVQEVAVGFDIFQIMQVSKLLNKKADALSKLAGLNVQPFQKRNLGRGIEEDEPCWMTPIVEFLSTGTLPIDSTEARKIKMKAPMSQNSRVQDNAAWVLLAVNVHRFREGNTQMSVMSAACTGPGGVKFLVVAIDYFTKWVEAKPLKTISGKQIHNFVWENIVCRFGISNEIVSDNGTQFEASRVEDTGKLGPKWEGPYKVIGVSDTGAYRLASLDGRAIKRTWNAQTLKRSTTLDCFRCLYTAQDGDLHSVDYAIQLWFTCLKNPNIGVAGRLLNIDIDNQ